MYLGYFCNQNHNILISKAAAAGVTPEEIHEIKKRQADEKENNLIIPAPPFRYSVHGGSDEVGKPAGTALSGIQTASGNS